MKKFLEVCTNILYYILMGILISFLITFSAISIAVSIKAVDVAYDNGGYFSDLINDLADTLSDENNYSKGTKSIVANAAEEVATATYNNYTIELSSAPIHFVYPYMYSLQSSSSPSTYFNEVIVDVDTSSSATFSFVDMLYQVIDNEGTIYSENIVRVGYVVDAYIPNDSINAQNSYNGIALTRAQLSTYTGFSQLVSYSFDNQVYKRYRPVLTYNTTTAPFVINISSTNNLNLYNFKVRACSFHDFRVYGNIEPIWVDYTFTPNSVSTGFSSLYVLNHSSTTSSTPLYPIERSDNAIFNDGYNQGYNTGYNTGYTEGNNAGVSSGFEEGREEGYNQGYTIGKNQGFNDGVTSANDYSFLSMLTAVVDAPVSVFSQMFDFNVLGFNMTTFFFSMLTLCLVIAIIKRLL